MEIKGVALAAPDVLTVILEKFSAAWRAAVDGKYWPHFHAFSGLEDVAGVVCRLDSVVWWQCQRDHRSLSVVAEGLSPGRPYSS